MNDAVVPILMPTVTPPGERYFFSGLKNMGNTFAALIMVMGKYGAAHNGQIGVAAHKIMGEAGNKSNSLAKAFSSIFMGTCLSDKAMQCSS